MGEVSFRAGDRAKVVDHASRHYGRVGTVVWFMRGTVALRMSDGVVAFLDWDALRNVTKKGRRRSA